MPRLNGKHVNMTQFERWEARCEYDAGPESNGSKEQYMEKVRMIRSNYALAVKTQGASYEPAIVQRLIETHGFRLVVKSLRAVSPKAQRLFVKYIDGGKK